MIRHICIVAGLLLISGCEPSARYASFPVKPPEFKDCTFAQLIGEDGISITVARCPNSTTSVTKMEGKVKKTTIVIDGDEYIKKEQEDDDTNSTTLN